MFNMIVYILAVIFVAYFNVDPVRCNLIGKPCRLTIKEVFTDSSPLYVDADNPGTHYPGRIVPTVLPFPEFTNFSVYCPGSEAKLGGDALQSKVPLVVRCIGDQLFELQGSERPHFDLKELQCSQKPSPTDWTNGYTCGRGRVFWLGYKMDNFEKESIGACYDDIVGTTYWAVGIIVPSIAAKQTVKRLDFKKGSFYTGINIAKFYKGCEQIETFINIFEYKGRAAVTSDDDVNDDSMNETDLQKREEKIYSFVRNYISKYIRIKPSTKRIRQDKSDSTPDDAIDPLTKPNYFVKGHLIAQADQFYATEQFVTYSYANALPMWDSINNGNWKRVEMEVRELAAQKNGLDVLAGGLGVLKLEGQDIYLGRRKHQRNPVMPVPQILYKAVFSSSTNEAIVYLAINNPYVTDDELKDYAVCKEYSKCRNEIYDDKYKGYVWCCLYWDFINAPKVKPYKLVTNVPENVKPMF